AVSGGVPAHPGGGGGVGPPRRGAATPDGALPGGVEPAAEGGRVPGERRRVAPGRGDHHHGDLQAVPGLFQDVKRDLTGYVCSAPSRATSSARCTKRGLSRRRISIPCSIRCAIPPMTRFSPWLWQRASSTATTTSLRSRISTAPTRLQDTGERSR